MYVNIQRIRRILSSENNRKKKLCMSSLLVFRILTILERLTRVQLWNNISSDAFISVSNEQSFFIFLDLIHSIEKYIRSWIMSRFIIFSG